ncbi:MAG: hypothetical protein IT513_09885 [Burkholderiales bacterium]|nr:hypothetical protein [Burkholderiales bacterium]
MDTGLDLSTARCGFSCILDRMTRSRLLVLFAQAALFFLASSVRADAELDAEVVRAKRIVAEVSALTPGMISALDSKEATRIAATWERASVALSHAVAARTQASSGQDISATFGTFLESNGLQGLTQDEMLKRVKSIAARADPRELDAAISELEVRFPAYSAYQRRVRVRTVIEKLSPAMKTVEGLRTGGRPLNRLPDSALAGVRAAPGVRSAAYADGRFSVVFDERVAAGGTLDVEIVSLERGKSDWRCAVAPSVEKFAPAACRR